MLRWGNDLDAPNERDAEAAAYIAECVRIREALDSFLDAQGLCDQAYSGKLDFQSGWHRAIFVLRVGLQAWQS